MGYTIKKSSEIVRSIQSNQWSWMRRAVERCNTHKQMLNLRKQMLFNRPEWRKLPKWARAKLSMLWDLYFEKLQRNLAFAYVCPNTGKRIAIHLDEDIMDHQAIGTASREKTLGDFCYIVIIQGKLYYIEDSAAPTPRLPRFPYS